MKRRSAVIFIALAVVAGSHAISVPRAAAHTATAVHFPSGWQETGVNMYWSNAPGSPNWWHTVPNIALRMVDAINQWNGVVGADNIHMGTPGNWDNLPESGCSAGPNVNGMFWTALDGGGQGTLAGQVRTCVYQANQGRIHHVMLLIDGQEPNWWTGGGAPPANTIDLFSVAAHETGHAHGFFNTNNLHWEQVDPQRCPPGDLRHTMCGVIQEGTFMQRTPATHDRDTFANRY